MIQPCNTSNQYVLFSSNSTLPTRIWSRAETSGLQSCAPFVHQKLKYTVLKNPDSTASMPPILKNMNITSDMISIGNIRYKVPCIFIPYIDEIRKLIANNVSLPKIIIFIVKKYDIQLRDNIPLSQYKTRYTYLAGENKLHVSPEIRIRNCISMGLPYTNDYLVQYIYTTYVDPFNLSSGFNIFIKKNCIQYLSICNNDGLTFTNNVLDLYPNGSASYLGSKILTAPMQQSYYSSPISSYTAVINLSPLQLTKYNGNYFSSYGILLNLPITNNLFVFIPLTITTLSFLTMIYPIPTYCTLPDIYTQISSININNILNQYDKQVKCKYIAEFSPMIFTQVDKLSNTV